MGKAGSTILGALAKGFGSGVKEQQYTEAEYHEDAYKFQLWDEKAQKEIDNNLREHSGKAAIDTQQTVAESKSGVTEIATGKVLLEAEESRLLAEYNNLPATGKPPYREWLKSKGYGSTQEAKAAGAGRTTGATAELRFNKLVNSEKGKAYGMDKWDDETKEAVIADWDWALTKAQEGGTAKPPSGDEILKAYNEAVKTVNEGPLSDKKEAKKAMKADKNYKGPANIDAYRAHRAQQMVRQGLGITASMGSVTKSDKVIAKAAGGKAEEIFDDKFAGITDPAELERIANELGTKNPQARDAVKASYERAKAAINGNKTPLDIEVAPTPVNVGGAQKTATSIQSQIDANFDSRRELGKQISELKRSKGSKEDIKKLSKKLSELHKTKKSLAKKLKDANKAVKAAKVKARGHESALESFD